MRRRCRRGQARDFDKKEYDGHQPKAETVFSVEKRKMGSHVVARVPGILIQLGKDGIALLALRRGFLQSISIE
jgi:hypothetical protein